MAPWWKPGPSKLDRILALLTAMQKSMATGFATVEGLLIVTNDEYNTISAAVAAQGTAVTTAAGEIEAAVSQLTTLPANDPRAQQLADAVTASTTSLKTESDKLAQALAGLAPAPAAGGGAAPAAGQ